MLFIELHFNIQLEQFYLDAYGVKDCRLVLRNLKSQHRIEKLLSEDHGGEGLDIGSEITLNTSEEALLANSTSNQLTEAIVEREKEDGVVMIFNEHNYAKEIVVSIYQTFLEHNYCEMNKYKRFLTL